MAHSIESTVKSTGAGLKERLSHKIGPLPVYGWAAIGGVIVLLVATHGRKRRATAQNVNGFPASYPQSGGGSGGGSGSGAATVAPPSTSGGGSSAVAAAPSAVAAAPKDALTTAPASYVKLFQPTEYANRTGDKTSVIGHFDTTGPLTGVSQGTTLSETLAADKALRAANPDAVAKQEAAESANVAPAQRGKGIVIGTRSDGTPLIVYR